MSEIPVMPNLQQAQDGVMPRPHRVTLVLERGYVGVHVGVRLVCPEGGCQPVAACRECGRPVDDREAEDAGQPGRCEWCPTGDEECWIKSWFDNLSGEEMYDGPELDLTGRTFPVPIECSWDGDSLTWRVVGEAREPVVDPHEARLLEDGWA
jgi:hypothetical protein